MLCYLNDEAGADNVQDLLLQSQNNQCDLYMNLVNLAEIYYTIQRHEGLERASEVLAIIENFPMKLEIVNKELALLAANLKAKFPIALADCFCAATASKYSASVVTGDPEFEKLEEQISIMWLPKKS
ncbi:MAG: type II toxin-antitoxin system VapC family toxin [Calditrichaeota bacterium]|nr:MAG: type II toxin-antitoxin system VapC family toxin [Calditrichota bacterium]